jgi:plastocyanin
MAKGLSTLLACVTVVLIAGCGSSSTSSSSGTTPTGTRSTGAATAASGLKVDTAPRFAAPEASAPVQRGVIQIAYRNDTIDPDTLRAKVGSTVTWTNYDSQPHNVTSEGGPLRFASNDFGEGATFALKLTKPGVIHYESTTEPATMNGSIEVVE